MAMQLKNLSALSSTLSVTLLEASIVPLRRVGIMTSEVGVIMIFIRSKDDTCLLLNKESVNL